MSYFNFDSDKFAQMHAQQKKNVVTPKSNSNLYRFPSDGSKTRIRLLPNALDAQQYPFKELLFYRIESLSQNNRPLEILSPSVLDKPDPILSFIEKLSNNQIDSFKNMPLDQRNKVVRFFNARKRYYYPFIIKGEKTVRYWECSENLHQKIYDKLVMNNIPAFYPNGYDFEVWKESFTMRGQERTRTVFDTTANCDFGFSEEALKDVLESTPKLLKEFRLYNVEELEKVLKDVLTKNNILSDQTQEEPQQVEQEEETVTYFDSEENNQEQVVQEEKAEESTNQIDIIGSEQEKVQDEITGIFGDIDL